MKRFRNNYIKLIYNNYTPLVSRLPKANGERFYIVDNKFEVLKRKTKKTIIIIL